MDFSKRPAGQGSIRLATPAGETIPTGGLDSAAGEDRTRWKVPVKPGGAC
jgi:hypothetical protein